MNILSFQSAVAYGHVGHSAAVFPLQRLGFEVWPVDTVQFSNHPGYGFWQGAPTPPSQVAALVEGLDAVGALAQCDAVLSGYLGEAATGPAVLQAVARVKAHRAKALYLCDPVMGDVGTGVYVRPGLPEFFATQAVPAADVITPNPFELEVLSGHPAQTMATALTAARLVIERGPPLVVVTGLADGAGLAALAVTATAAWVVRTPRLPLPHPVNGAGDCLAALLLAHLLRGLAPAEAVAQALAGLWAVLEQTLAEGRRELALVAAQDRLVRPLRRFVAEAI